jgi:uncharacterized membrane protein YphA (DoxX/SURF4 family)
MFHKEAIDGPKSGELAFIYLAGFAALFFTGAGKLSLDKMLFGKPGKSPSSQPKKK